MTTIDEKQVGHVTDALWRGYVRARFLKRACEILETDIPFDLYREIMRDERVKPDERLQTFVKCLGKQEFVGRVCYHAVRVHFGD